MNSKNHKLHIIGFGPGGENYLLPIAKKEIEEADCLIGAKRLILLFRKFRKEEFVIDGNLNKIIPYVKKYQHKKKMAILVSGDPGMYSFLDKFSKQFNKEDYVVIPGISTIQLAFSRIGQSWHDAKIFSLHGRKINNIVSQITAYKKVFLFTDPSFPPDKIAASLLKKDLGHRRVVVFENLSYPNERIIDTDLIRLSKIRGWGLNVMIIEEINHKTSKGKLYGIGIGPGDPKLITLRAKEVLDKVDTIFVPKSSNDGPSLARSIVETAVAADKYFVELTFPMTTDEVILNKYWESAANRIAKDINQGKEVAFVTIGDPLIYSTYVYLFKTLSKNFPNIPIETIPGVSAFNAASAAANLTLVESDEKLAVLPVTRNLKGLRKALIEFDTIVLMKVGSKLDKVIDLLKKLKLINKARLISRVGLRDEKIVNNLASLPDKKAGYLSVIIVKK